MSLKNLGIILTNAKQTWPSADLKVTFLFLIIFFSTCLCPVVELHVFNIL